MALSYGCIVPHSPNLVPEVSDRARAAAATREAMSELGMNIGVRKPRTCVIVSPHSPFLAEAFGVWESEKLKGSMARFQAPEVTIELATDRDLVEAIVDVASRMELPVGRMEEDWQLDRGITVPGLYLFSSEVKVVPVATSMLGWDEHWLFGTAIAKAAQLVGTEVAIVASSNLSHRVAHNSPHGYHSRGREFDERVRTAVEQGRLSRLLDIPHEVVREASECGLIPMLVLGGAFDGHAVSGKILSYEHPFGIGYLVAEVCLAEGEPVPREMRVSAEVGVKLSGSSYDDVRRLLDPL